MVMLLMIALVVTLFVDVLMLIFMIASFVMYLKILGPDYHPSKDEWKETD